MLIQPTCLTLCLQCPTAKIEFGFRLKWIICLIFHMFAIRMKQCGLRGRSLHVAGGVVTNHEGLTEAVTTSQRAGVQIFALQHTIGEDKAVQQAAFKSAASLASISAAVVAAAKGFNWGNVITHQVKSAPTGILSSKNSQSGLLLFLLRPAAAAAASHPALCIHPSIQLLLNSSFWSLTSSIHSPPLSITVNKTARCWRYAALQGDRVLNHVLH